MRRQDKFWAALLLAILLFVFTSAWADSNNPVRITGAQTPGDCVQISSTNVLADSGSACGGGGGGSVAIASTTSNVDYFPLVSTNTSSAAATIYIDKTSPWKYNPSTGLTSVLALSTTSIVDSGAASFAGTTTLGGSGTVLFGGSNAGSTQLKATATASGVLTLPAATDTLIGKATTDTLTNKTYDTAGSGNSFSINGLAVSTNTGTGSVVRATSPTLVTPVLGVATATSLDGAAIGVTTSAAGVFTTLAAGATAITSTSATALTVGTNGTTTPIFTVDDSTSSAVAGLKITGAVTGGTVAVIATDSGSNTNISIGPKGAGTALFGSSGAGVITYQGNSHLWRAGGTQIGTWGGGGIAIQPTPLTNGAHFTMSSSLDINMTASANIPIISLWLTAGGVRQHSTGALALQTDYLFNNSVNSFAGASVLTDAASINIAGPPGCGTNATCTNVEALNIPTLALVTTGAITNSYGIKVAAATGATNNYAASLDGLVVLPSISTDATHTTSSLCQDTTTHVVYFGSGAAGICLGTSSERFKSGIITMKAGVEELLKLRAVNFYYKDDSHGPSHTKIQYGFIAEEAVNAMPDLVGLDSQGQPNTFDYTSLISVLVHAVQQQQQELDTLHGAFPFHKCFLNLLICPN